MQLTGARILWESLVREGVDVVFGYPGGAILPAYDAMLDRPTSPASRCRSRSTTTS
jgi:acetolactate synthase-1/2/3 large subunit